MDIRQWLQNAVINLVAQRKIASIPEENVYALTYAQYHKACHRNGTRLHDSAAALDSRVSELIRERKHHYDMVVLHKDSQRVKVRDRRGTEHDLLDCVTNSYNDLEWVDENREALVRFVRDSALSSCISRKIAGLHDVHDQLGRELADYMGYDACVLGTCGYISQISTVFALFHQGDVIFSDQHNHSSLVDGCRLSHAKVIPFPHRDYDALEKLVKKHRGSFNGAGIISDGVFSTRGNVGDIGRIVDIARRHRCLSVVDDTHGVLVCGRKGRGVIDLFDAKPDVLTGGFGKAFGSFGGFALASRELATAIDVLGRQNVNTSFMSPVMAAQSLIHFRYYRDNQSKVQGELMSGVRSFNAELGRFGLACYPTPDHHVHPIFCLYKRSESETLRCHNELIDKGLFCSFFPPPVARFPSLRFSLHRCLPESKLVEAAQLLGAMQLFVDGGGTVGQRAAEDAPAGGDTLLSNVRSRAASALEDLRQRRMPLQQRSQEA